MSIEKNVKITKIFKEFSEEENNIFFNLKAKQIFHNIDSFYYSIFLENDSKDNLPFDLDKLFLLFDDLREECDKNNSSVFFEEDEGVVFNKRRFKGYTYCLSKPNFFDIFFMPKLPNNCTPRIFVQLRSIGLWSSGTYNLIKESYIYISNLLKCFNCNISKTQENRIDYCYHTNYYQKIENLMSDNALSNNLYTSFKIYSKTGRLNNKDVTIEYLSLGNRKSNNLFYRNYNKVREVIEQGYKRFFLDIWLSLNLINKYDYYVYNYAYDKKSYSKIYEGMIKFYIDNGKDINLINKYKKMLNSTNVTSEDFRKELKGVLPTPTLILNLEYQTMRKFYYYADDLIDTLPIVNDCEEIQLLRLFQILDNRKIFLDYLNKDVVRYIKSKDLKKKDFEDIDFWKRLRTCKLDTLCNVKFSRNYDSKNDINLIASKILSNISTLNLYLGNETTDYAQDIYTAINILNDNDIKDNDIIENNKYFDIKEKRKMLLKSLLKK